MRLGLKRAVGAAAAVLGGAAAIVAISDLFQAPEAELDIPNVYKKPGNLSERTKSILEGFPHRLLGLGSAPVPLLKHPVTKPRPEEEMSVEPDLSHVPLKSPCAVSLARAHPDEVAQIRQDAEEYVAQAPLPPRFTDAELMRHAIHHGFLRAKDAAGRSRALSYATSSVAHTVEWLRCHNFSTEEELERFEHLVWWGSTASPGERPKMHVAIGRAALECRGPEAVHFANAVITHVERAVRERLSDEDGMDRVDVVVYATGASTMSASRVGWVLKAVVLTLSRHYPGRLNDLTLLDLPKVLTVVLLGAKKIVNPATARKMRTMSSDEFQELQEKSN